MEAIILESCHSIWIFDAHRRRYCRVLKGIEVSHRRIATEWRSYSYLEIDVWAARFTLFLGSDRSRIIRSWIHTDDCRQCTDHQTAEVWIEDIPEALSVAHHPAKDSALLPAYAESV